MSSSRHLHQRLRSAVEAHGLYEDIVCTYLHKRLRFPVESYHHSIAINDVEDPFGGIEEPVVMNLMALELRAPCGRSRSIEISILFLNVVP